MSIQSIEVDALANQIAGMIKSDVIKTILNDPALAANGIVTPDGGTADAGIKNFADFCTAAIRRDDKRITEIYGIKATQIESSGTTVGYAIPPEYGTMIEGIALEESIIRPGAFVIPMSSPEFKAPRLDQTISPDGSSAFLSGVKLYWTAEAGNLTQTSMQFSQIDIKVNKMGGYIQTSDEAMKDAPALSAMLIRQFGLAKAWFEDYNFLQGNGVGKPLGILNAPATYSQSRDTASDFKIADAVNMIARLPASSKRRAVWIMHQSVEPKLSQMATSGNFVTFLPNLQNEPVMRLLGREVYFTEKLPELGTAGDVMLIDRQAYYIGDRGTMQISSSDAPGFLSDIMTIKMTVRVDGQPALNDKITLASGSYQVSPFVKLN
jgi:HK97 family phage major capsid protein